jgi:hypothetical protein
MIGKDKPNKIEGDNFKECYNKKEYKIKENIKKKRKKKKK